MRVWARGIPWRNYLLGVNFSEIKVRMLSGKPSDFMINYIHLKPFFGRDCENHCHFLSLEAMFIMA